MRFNSGFKGLNQSASQSADFHYRLYFVTQEASLQWTFLISNKKPAAKLRAVHDQDKSTNIYCHATSTLALYNTMFEIPVFRNVTMCMALRGRYCLDRQWSCGIRTSLWWSVTSQETGTLSYTAVTITKLERHVCSEHHQKFWQKLKFYVRS